MLRFVLVRCRYFSLANNKHNRRLVGAFFVVCFGVVNDLYLASVMQFAVDTTGQRLEPAPKAKGKCPVCDAPVIAKCGEILTWHWSHLTKDCDPWYEPESEWHRQWKEQFPCEWREFVIGRHRADVKTPKGVIEFQASCISASDIQERENFYGRMVWVVKADSFDFEKQLSPQAWSKYCRNRNPIPILPPRHIKGSLLDLLGTVYSETEEEKTKKRVREFELQQYEKMEQERNSFNSKIWNQSWNSDPMYRWRWPRKSWTFATKKIYLDRGDDLFRVDWISPDGKKIKGKHCTKKWFIQRALCA